MAYMLDIALVAVFFVAFAMRISEGLWSNAITFFNVLTAGLIASNYFEPAANFIEEQVSNIRYFADFLGFWVIFIAVFLILKLITDQASRIKVRFRKPVESAGGLAFAALTGWLMVTFSLFTFHMAPLEVASFGGGFQKDPNASMFFGLAPDKKWLAFLQSTSDAGALDRFGDSSPAANFDPNSDFILRYQARRAALEQEQSLFPD